MKCFIRHLACACALVVVPAVGLGGCGSSGGGASGSGGNGGPVLCKSDGECADDGNECTVPACDLSTERCGSAPVAEGTPCADDGGICRGGQCLPTELKAFIKSPNPQPDARFGTGVVIEGNTMAVGAPSVTPGFGEAAVFERTDDEWTQVFYVGAPVVPGGGQFGGLFGWSLALDGDTLFVGTLGIPLGGPGSARPYERVDGEWSIAGPRLVGSDTTEFDNFGTSLDLSGDTLVVGAPGRNNDGGDAFSGAAYVFDRVDGSWLETDLLEASNTGSSWLCECEGLVCGPTSGVGDAFGVSVAISGDMIVVGAPAEASAAQGVDGDETDNSAPDSGAAYVFERVEGVWTQTAYLKASNTDEGDYFGFNVAIDGDTIVVSAEREDSSATGAEGKQADNQADDAGAAYVFERVGSSWEQTTYLKASNAREGAFFGATLALEGDRLLIGAPGESSVGGEGSGAAYVFERVDGEFTQTNFFKAFNAEEGAEFAGPRGVISFSLYFDLCEVQQVLSASSLDVSGNTSVVGAPFEDSSGVGVNGVPTMERIPDSGAVYVFVEDE
jgi:hypothetical protein